MDEKSKLKKNDDFDETEKLKSDTNKNKESPKKSEIITSIDTNNTIFGRDQQICVCPFCHMKNYSTKISRDLMAYNLVMELEVSCNNVGKCPWIGHLSELVAHQNLCDKTIKILEDNNKKFVKNISKRFSYDREKLKENENNDSTIFCMTENKKNKKLVIDKDTEIMINNLEIMKQKFLDKTNKKNNEVLTKEQINNLKKLFL